MDPGEELIFRVFKNHLIFENISGHLDLKDLKSFRGAHSGFNEASLSVILKRTRPVELERLLSPMHKQTRMRQRLWNREIDLVTLKRDINSLATLISNSSGFPCSEFVLRTGVFNRELGDDLLLDNFLSAISGFVTELELVKDLHDRTFYYETPTLNDQFEQLKTLKINYYGNAAFKTYVTDDRNKDVAFFSNIFAHSPNLTTLDINNVRCFGSFDDKFVTLWLEATRDSQWQKIKNLSLEGIIKARHFTKLQQFGVELKCLSVSFHTQMGHLGESSAHGTIPISFLQSQSNSLETLKITWTKWTRMDFSSALSFPRMCKLKMLSIDGFQCKNIWQALAGLSFVENFPALKHLSVCEPSTDFFHSEMQPLTTVTSLHLLDHLVAPKLVEQAARVFPGVKTLTIYGELDTLQSVNAHMKAVTELIISGGNDEELLQALSGYTKAELDRQSRHNILPEKREALDLFKKLQILRFRNVAVDDIMCEHGLLKLTSLVTLDLMQLPDTRIDVDVVARMKQRFKVLLKPECVVAH